MATSSLAPRYTDAPRMTEYQSDMLRVMNDAEIIRLIPTVILLSLIAGLGMLGNSVVIHVYRTRYKVSNSKLFIISVGAIDLLSCCVAIPLEIPLLLQQYTFQQPWLCKVSRFFNTFGTCSSSFILLFIAIDRYRKVCKPLARQITPTKAKYLCILSVVLGLFVSWPAVFVYGKQTFQFQFEGIEILGSECSTSDNMSDSKIPFYYAMLFGLLFIAGITSMSILYCMIGFKIRRQARKMSNVYSFRNMSIPMTSSIIAENDVRKSSDVTPNCLDKFKSSKKNGLYNKKNVKRPRRESSNDDSYTDKREYELSFEYEQNQGIQNKDFDISDEVVDNETPQAGEQEVNKDDGDRNDNTKQQPSDENDVELGKDENPQRQSSGSLESSGSILPNGDRTFRQRMSSIGSSISHVLRRMTSITSGSTDPNSGTIRLRKSQYLKQARARKTAFVMFVISLAYIISYLPHLVLIIMRQVNSSFVEDLSDTGRALYKFFLRSYFLNCAINPVIYGLFDSRFRSACKEILDACRCQGK